MDKNVIIHITNLNAPSVWDAHNVLEKGNMYSLDVFSRLGYYINNKILEPDIQLGFEYPVLWFCCNMQIIQGYINFLVSRQRLA